MTESAEYKTWCGIKRRCHNKNERCFHNYGGRGIRMAPEWATSFEQFLADMGPRPSCNHTIERLDRDGHYEKANCTWLEARLQAKNRRNNVMLTYRGETKILTDWAAEIGISNSVLQARLYRGWSAERALTEPLDISRRNKLAKKVPRAVAVAVEP